MTVLLFSKSNTTPQKIRWNYGGLENDVTLQMKDLQILFSDFAHVLTIRFHETWASCQAKNGSAWHFKQRNAPNYLETMCAICVLKNSIAWSLFQHDSTYHDMIKRNKLATIFALTSVLVQENMYDSDFQHVSTKRVLSFSSTFSNTRHILIT